MYVYLCVCSCCFVFQAPAIDPSIRVVQDGSHGSIGRAGMSDPSLHFLGGVDLPIHLAAKNQGRKHRPIAFDNQNMAKKCPFIGDFHIETSIYRECSIAMFD